ncbi:MAG TPA: hypothetical protein VIC85_00535 [Ktedonobacterales bacterium]|jgi:hypothetical protein
MLPTFLDQPEIDFLILADRAEVLNGKLYLMGGAWDQIGVADFARPLTFSLAVGLVIPWNATNVDHTLELSLLDEDGNALFQWSGGFKTGRPTELPQGASQHSILAFTVSVVLPHAGTYRAEAHLNHTSDRATAFVAHSIAASVPTQTRRG